MINNKKPWESHYKKSKSILIYPDENLVRLLIGYLGRKKKTGISAVDIGCGSGRHLNLLCALGIKNVLGIDLSINALSIINGLYDLPAVLGENSCLPLKDRTFNIAISWGSLHYCGKDKLAGQVHEIHRILRNRGRLFGTLRSDRDTYLKKGKHLGKGTWRTSLKDLSGQVVSFYSEKELKAALKIFRKSQYGLMERTIVGDTGRLISHWIFWAEK